MKLFITGFIQVFFISVQTYLIAHKYYYVIIPVGFLISLIWTYNVKKVVFGTITDRVLYSLGASLGAFTGLILTVELIKIIA
jgi:hypothetical protein